MKALVGAFNQEKALVGAFSVIVKTGCGTDGAFYSTNPVCAGGQRRAADVAAGGRAVAADGDGQPRHQVCLPQPARGLHEDDLLQTLDREGHRPPLLSCDRYSSLDTILKIDIYTVDIRKCVSLASELHHND